MNLLQILINYESRNSLNMYEIAAIELMMKFIEMQKKGRNNKWDYSVNYLLHIAKKK